MTIPKISILLLVVAVIGGGLIFPNESQSESINVLQPVFQKGNIEVVAVEAGGVYQPEVSDTPTASQLKQQQTGISAKVTKIEFQDSREPTKTSQANPVDLGLNFLVQNQDADGSWSYNGRAEITETAAVMKLLGQLSGKVGQSTSTEQQLIDIAYPLAKDWFIFSFPENNDYIAEKVAVLSEAGEDVLTLAEFLAAQINETDLGFGFQKRYGSDFITTAKVLEAITESGYQDPGADLTYTLKAVLLYLLNAQNLDGGWSEVNGISSIFATNLVLEALRPYQAYIIADVPGGDIVIQTRINLGLNYLKNLQQANGTWLDKLLETALSYDTLTSYGEEPVYNQAALDYLLASQNPDGSFSNSGFYKTAKSVQALAKPDIAVTNIQDISNLLPNEPAVVRITIQNLGYITSKPINLALAPSDFVLNIDGQDIFLDFSGLGDTINFSADSTLVLEIILQGLSFGPHDIQFRVEYDESELKKGNNALTRNLIFDDPQFTGPAPPPWVGAATGDSAGMIRLRWHLSNDSTTARYAVYASTISGGYDPVSPLYISSDNQSVGVDFTFNSNLYGTPIYFTIASLNTSGTRGDYTMETWVVPYSNPAGFVGTISGQVVDNNNNNVPQARIDLYSIGFFDADGVGNYLLNYFPGFYWVTASKTGYNSDSKEIEIIAQGSSTSTFNLQIIDDDITPASITGLAAKPDDGEISLSWNQFQDTSGDFKHFNIYRSTSPISDVSLLTPIDESITDSTTTSFVDSTIINGIDYYYAVTAEDMAGNFNPIVQSVGPIKGNSAPQLSNLTASQEGGNVNIAYDLTDAENSAVQIDFQYWDGATWQNALTTIGEGNQLVGQNKAGAWNAKQDLPDFNGQTKIKIIANDNESVNNLFESETGFINLDTQDPAPPTVIFATTTTQFNQTISGTKEPGTAIYINGEEAVSLNTSSLWSYKVILAEGDNYFTVAARDTFGNKSEPVQITIFYDGNFTCGDFYRDGVINILDLNYLVDYLFFNGADPIPIQSGDVNSDGAINNLDLDFLIDYIFFNGQALVCPP